ncbi:MAG: tetratricopeptide repeat protein [Trueperaceae bacterium]|nr:tetratricopeptide repeat protein [Trueperaceae bacterium]
MELLDRYIMAGRLAGQLGQPNDAVTLFTEGLERYPDEPRLLRYRGHRYISVRRFEDARRDLSQAAEITQGWQDEHEFYGPQIKDDFYRVILGKTDELEYDRVPVNEETTARTRHLYKASLLASIHYHLALSHYLLGDFDKAIASYRDTIDVAVDDEIKVAASDWKYMALRRLGRHDEASASLNELELGDGAFMESYYYRRWRMYKGELQPADLIDPTNPDKTAVATQGYGVGNWYFYQGDKDRAIETFKLVTASGAKDAFGYIASETDLARLGNP